MDTVSARARVLALAWFALSGCSGTQPAPPAPCPIVRPARSSRCDDASERTCAYREPDGCYSHCRCLIEAPDTARRWICERICAGRPPVREDD